jgi:asparagine synthase (glutamine-hydrolysing)
MCGVFASIGFEPDCARIDIVRHRGPDGSGWRTFASDAGPVALGHRRLAIIDLSDAALQPMADPMGRYHLVFNGEIYNYVELREEMRAQGEVFSTDSDSEVLLRAYALWGEGALAKLRGMFAFAIWDSQARRLFAARDRFGIKPLYFVAGAGGVALGSEIKQLLGLPGVASRMNVARVHDFLSSGVIDHTSETLFSGVSQLRGGERLIVETREGRPVVETRRWYPVGAGELDLSEADAAARFRALLEESVRLHLRSDVPVGSCLSGGLDSSSIVCLAAPRLGGDGARMHTISACYAEKAVDEKPFIDAVVAHARTQPHYVWPKADDVFQKASDITWHQDEPFGSTSLLAQWLVFDEARRAGVKVMLDGQGADEQLAGYHSGFDHHLAAMARRGDLIGVARTARARRALHGASIPTQLLRMIAPLLPDALAPIARRRRQAMTQHDWLGSDLIRAQGNPLGAITLGAQSLGLKRPRDVRDLCLAMTFASNLQMLLHWEDRNSMAHSIEARVPFLDHPLVEFSLALGNAHKFVGADTKRVLRRAMADTLPRQVAERRDKLGFATPEETWFRGPLAGAMRERLEATLARYPELFNAAGARAFAADMLEGRRPIDFALWRIVSLGLWGERFGVAL